MRKLLVATLGLLAACGGSDSSESSAESYADDFHGAFCELLVRCGAVSDQATCLDTNLGLVFATNENELAAIKQGRAEFRPANATACLDAFAELGCDMTSRAFRVLPDACANTTTGKVPADGTCVLNAECSSRVCAVPSCNEACCLGTCVGDAPTIAHAGESCEIARCDEESFCDSFGSLECVPLQPVDGFCISFDECDYGLDCLSDATCGRLPGPGEPCAGPCRDIGTTCSPTSNTCVAVALVGEDCASSADCSPYYSCDETKHCNPGLAIGAPCVQGQRCAGDRAFCDPQNTDGAGVCARPKPDGGACTTDFMCESLFCERDPGAVGACAPEPICL